MANISTIIKSKSFKKSREKKITKLEEELGFRNQELKKEYYNIKLEDFVFVGLLIVFLGLMAWFIGGVISLCSFIWNTGGLFDKIVIMSFDVAVIVIVVGIIYSIFKSD